MKFDIVYRLENPPLGTETSERNLMQAAAEEIKRLRALTPPEPTEGQVERAIDLAMSWQPSERGLSYAERRREVMDLLAQALRAMPLQDHAGRDSEQWALLYLHDWDPPREGQEHKWQPGLNVFPEIHGTYATITAADQARAKMSDPNKYWVRRSRVILAEQGTSK